MDVKERSIKLHEKLGGKIETKSKIKMDSIESLSLAYTPGVAAVCELIHEDKTLAKKLTMKKNTIAVISDGSAVLGLGNIGPYAAIPVMEGKAVLFKEFGDVDAYSLCLDTQDTEEIIRTIKLLSVNFAGINLEDISAPRCFEIERRLSEELDIPVFHDDQHGTAIVVLAALLNSLKLKGVEISSQKCVINGSGAAGVAIAKLLHKSGIDDIVLCDSKGAISSKRDDLNDSKLELLTFSNKYDESGSIHDVIKNKDIFIGVSKGNLLDANDIRAMARNPIVFAMANPTPEILPQIAIEGGAFIIGTGRSDYPNQVNNVLAFPGIFRGAIDSGASTITEDMKLAAAYGIASVLEDWEINTENILPKPFDKRLLEKVSNAVRVAYDKYTE
jgi:malate dehydrogenase (oxaloacetate-decarboxylating)